MEYVINIDKYTACGIYETKCGKHAIVKGLSSLKIDDSKCNVCGRCVMNCTFKAINMVVEDIHEAVLGDNDVMKYVDGIEPFKTINDAEDFIRFFERNEQNSPSIC